MSWMIEMFSMKASLLTAQGLEHAEVMKQLGQGNFTRDQGAVHLREYSEPTVLRSACY